MAVINFLLCNIFRVISSNFIALNQFYLISQNFLHPANFHSQIEANFCINSAVRIPMNDRFNFIIPHNDESSS